MIPRFDAAVHYLHHGTYRVPKVSGRRDKPSRVQWVATRNLYVEDSWHAVSLMEATATQNPRVKEPGYHMGTSLPPGASLDREQWEAVADAILAKSGLRLAAAKRGSGAVVLEGDRPVSLSRVDRALSAVQLGRKFAEPLRGYLARRTVS